jgi:hypothetical protein
MSTGTNPTPSKVGREYINSTFPEDSERLDINRSRMIYAWNWFDFHAKPLVSQR